VDNVTWLLQAGADILEKKTARGYASLDVFDGMANEIRARLSE